MSTRAPGGRWFKSSYSDATGECLEVAWADDANVHVRDSKKPAGPVLALTTADWAAFTLWLRKGRAASI